jgi:hypothetical protein
MIVLNSVKTGIKTPVHLPFISAESPIIVFVEGIISFWIFVLSVQDFFISNKSAETKLGLKQIIKKKILYKNFINFKS